MYLNAGKFTKSPQAYRATRLQYRRLGDQNRLFPACRDGVRLRRHAGAHGFASVAGARLRGAAKRADEAFADAEGRPTLGG